MHQLKRVVRRTLAYTLYYTGLLWLYAGIRLRRKAVVLMYHRILDRRADSFSHEGIIVSPKSFDLQMAFLAKHFRPLTETQFKSDLARSSFRRRSCLVTFDDGWWDNLEHALPVLQRHHIPAIVFVATGYIGTGDTFWQERLARLLCIAAGRGGAVSEVLREIGFDGAAGLDPGEVRLHARAFVTSLKSLEPSVYRRSIERLRAALHDVPEIGDPGDDRFMTWEEVVALQRTGLVSIGSHAHSHRRLTSLGYKSARQELETSRDDLAKHGICDVTACAYPNGDVDDSVEAAASDAGFILGFRTKGGLVTHRSEALHLRRVNIHESASKSRPEFLYRLLGLP